MDSGPLNTHRLITRVRISIGGWDVAEVNFAAGGIYLKPGDVLNVEFTDGMGHPVYGDRVGAKPGDIVLGPEDYRVVEDYKRLGAS